MPDVDGESPLLSGLGIGSLPAGGKLSLEFGVRTTAAVPSTQALALRGSITSNEESAPTSANGPQPLSLAQLRGDIKESKDPGSADPLGTVDLGPGSDSGFWLDRPRADPARAGHQSRLPAALPAGPAVRAALTISVQPCSARRLRRLLAWAQARPSKLTVPGLTRRRFRCRSAASPTSRRPTSSLPAGRLRARASSRRSQCGGCPRCRPSRTRSCPLARASAASANPQLKAPPFLELDLHVDRSRLNSDPTVAVVTTQGPQALDRAHRPRPGGSNRQPLRLSMRPGATFILAKILFLFLGLPGVLLAAYLSRFSGEGCSPRPSGASEGPFGPGGCSAPPPGEPAHLRQPASRCWGAVFGLGLGALAVIARGRRTPFGPPPHRAWQISAALAMAAGVVTTGLALYVPGRRALARETNEERRELEVGTDAKAKWLRLRLDIILIGGCGRSLVGDGASGRSSNRPARRANPSRSPSTHCFRRCSAGSARRCSPSGCCCCWAAGSPAQVRRILEEPFRDPPPQCRTPFSGAGLRRHRGRAGRRLRFQPGAPGPSPLRLRSRLTPGSSSAGTCGSHRASRRPSPRVRSVRSFQVAG